MICSEFGNAASTSAQSLLNLALCRAKMADADEGKRARSSAGQQMGSAACMSDLEGKTPRQGRRSADVSRQSEVERMAWTVALGRAVVMWFGVLAMLRRVDVGTLRMSWFACFKLVCIKIMNQCEGLCE